MGYDGISTGTASGAPSARPGLDQALAELGKSDTLVVWRLDRRPLHPTTSNARRPDTPRLAAAPPRSPRRKPARGIR